MGFHYLGPADVEAIMSDLDVVGVVRRTLVLHAGGHTVLPEEAYLPWLTADGHSARSLTLPAAVWDETPSIGVKIINSSLGNIKRGRARAAGLVVLFDPNSAAPIAVVDAARISAFRTAAYTALSANALVSNSEEVALIGCGALGYAHVDLLPEVGARRFYLYDVDTSRAEALKDSIREAGVSAVVCSTAERAVRHAQLVVTTTTTTEGYLSHRWLQPGSLVAHVSLDDVLPDVVELSDLIVVDDWNLVRSDRRRLLGRMYHDGLLAGPADAAVGKIAVVACTLADVLVGNHPGRTAPEQIILSNPFGMGILDVALASEVFAHSNLAKQGIALD